MKKIIILIRNVLDFILPETQLGDKIYSYINFIFNHKGRFPKNQVYLMITCLILKLPQK